jgi:PAS domain S-box-containing protein
VKARAPEGPLRTGNGRTVLIVDADPGVVAQGRRALEGAGYAVRTACGLAEALEALGQHRVDLLLLDDRLPGGDGLTFSARLQEAGHDLPVILMTASGGDAMVVGALRAGAVDFLAKSAEHLEYLPVAVERVLRQVETERQLAESEARLASVIGTARDAILVADAERRITLFNAAAERMFRCTAAEALGQPLARFLPDEPGTVGLVRGARADGEVFPLEASVSSTEVKGQVFYTVLAREASARVRAEGALRESEERFTTFMDNSPAIAFVKDEGGRYVYVSRGVQRSLGYEPADLLGKTDAELWQPETARALQEHDRAALASGKLLEVEETLPKASGGAVCCLAFKFPFPDRAGRRLLGGVAIDITAQKYAQEQLRQAAKMEGVGRLTAGLTHNFNNQLTVIAGCCELLLSTAPLDAPSRDLLQQVCKAGERAAALTRRLLDVSRQRPPSLEVVDLNLLVRESEWMLRLLLRSGIDLVTALAPELGRVRADPGGMQDVLVNLVANACDAMPRGGRLTLQTQNVDRDEAPAAQGPGRYVRLAVRDTGCGMDEATRAQAFEPFFTTKGVGKGTGLGLWMVHGVVQASGGHVEVDSAPGRGSTFEVYLPRLDEPDGQAAAGRMAPRGTETVLLAEDDEPGRSLDRLALESSGYTVVEARDGDEAVRAWQQHAGPIDLLVTDVLLPKMSGRQLVDALATLRPGLKVLFLSGYAEDAGVQPGALPEGMAFLPRPFPPIALARKVRELLGPV